MNKTVCIILIILLSVIGVFLTGIFVLLLKGNTNFDFLHINLGNTYSENLLVSKEYDETDEIFVEDNVGDVFVEVSENEKIIVEMYSDYSDNYSLENKDNKIYAKLEEKNNSFNLFRKSSRIIVKIPDSFAKTINVNTDVGDLFVKSFDNLTLNVTSKTGDVHVDKVDTLNTTISTGDIKVTKINSLKGKLNTGDIKVDEVYDIEATLTTGDIKVTNLYNKINADLVTGDVKINKAVINENSLIKTKTGDIKIDSLEGAYIEAENKTGDIRVRNNDRKLDTTIEIKSNVGDIKINQ